MAEQQKQSEVAFVLTEIAKLHLRLSTLETRNSDSLDFTNQAVWQIKDALLAAYNAGKAAQRAQG